MKLGELAADLGIGLVAGLVGTAAITASQELAMRYRHRKASKTPAKAVERVFDIIPQGEPAERRLNTLAHWGYGTSWGMGRGLLGALGVYGAPASVLHWAAVQGTAFTLLPAIGVTPPPTKWGAKAIAWEMLHHAVYATAAGYTFDRLSRGVTHEPSGHLWRNLALGAIAWRGAKAFLGGERQALSRAARKGADRLAHRDWRGAADSVRRELART